MSETERGPQLHEISALFEMLFGRSVEVFPARKKFRVEKSQHFFAGVYLDSRPHVTGLMACDEQLAVRAGAALSLFPPQKVDALAQAGEVDETFRENLGEVLNIAAQFFHGPFGTSTTLAKVFEVPMEAPPQLFQLVELAEKRRDYRISIQGYGDGQMALLYL